MSKEILISQPPSMGAIHDGIGSNMDMGNTSAMSAMPPPPPPISNYKGVMLCDRPISKDHGAHGGLQGLSEPMQAPFLSMVHAKHQLGLVPSKESRLNMDGQQEKRASTRKEFLVKHKKWLQQFNQDRKQEAQKKDDAAAAAVERKKRFEEYSKRMRDSIRQVKQDVDDPEMREQKVSSLLLGAKTEAAAQDEPRGGTLPSVPQEASRAAPKESVRSNSRGKVPSKPAWAMSASQAEQMEEEELNDLLTFAERLDYEKYIDDLEVRQAVLAVQERIKEIRLEQDEPAQLQATHEQDDAEWNRRFIEQWNAVSSDGVPPDYTINANALTSVDKLMGQNDGSLRSNKSVPLTESNLNAHAPPMEQVVANQDKLETQSHASLRSAMSNASARSIKQVHSTRSVRAIIEKRRNKMLAVAEDENQDPTGPTMRQPQVISYGVLDQNTQDKPQDSTMSNLPYLHRNPAV